jgi:hypothetical protein
MDELWPKFVRSLCKNIRPWVAELVIRGIAPERIGCYRILDWLLRYSEGGSKKEG